jgi:hypothetical protein
MKAYGADSLRQSIHMIQLENRWMKVDDIWYACYATRVYPKIALFSFLQLGIPAWKMNELVQ